MSLIPFGNVSRTSMRCVSVYRSRGRLALKSYATNMEVKGIEDIAGRDLEERGFQDRGRQHGHTFRSATAKEGDASTLEHLVSGGWPVWINVNASSPKSRGALPIGSAHQHEGERFAHRTAGCSATTSARNLAASCRRVREPCKLDRSIEPCRPVGTRSGERFSRRYAG